MSRLPPFLHFACYCSNFLLFLQLQKALQNYQGLWAKTLWSLRSGSVLLTIPFTLWLKLCLFLAFCDFPSPKRALLLTYAPAGLFFIPVSRQTSYLLSSHNNFSKIYISFTVNWEGSQAAYSYWTTQKLKSWFVFGLSFLFFLFSFFFLHSLTTSVIPATEARLCQSLNMNSVKMKLL